MNVVLFLSNHLVKYSDQALMGCATLLLDGDNRADARAGTVLHSNRFCC